jgi:hypothetical protein
MRGEKTIHRGLRAGGPAHAETGLGAEEIGFVFSGREFVGSGELYEHGLPFLVLALKSGHLDPQSGVGRVQLDLRFDPGDAVVHRAVGEDRQRQGQGDSAEQEGLTKTKTAR